MLRWTTCRGRTAIAFTHRLQLVRRLGPRWVAWRVGYELRKRSGLLRRRFPTPTWDQLSEDPVTSRKDELGRFFFELGAPPDRARLEAIVGAYGRERMLAVADDYSRGRFLYYSHQVHDLGWPPNWLHNPFHQGQHESATHWCDYPTYSPARGDIKDVWEPSRFACAYWLSRAYALTGDEKYPQAFWTLIDSWLAQNPPNRGPNFKCGQETALRCMAWCFALWTFWKSPATTEARVSQLVAALAFQAVRIAGNIDFAISQKNNHALSEAVGVLTVGVLFPELKGAAGWEALGRRVLEREVPRQIYEDGSYIQQSMNYHRVMLHDCLWAIHLAELNGRPLSGGLRDRVAKAGEFLFEMLGPDSGRVPNYGPNDGALVLPLSACDYLDYRPTVQAARYLATGRRVLPPGPWDETLLWLFGPEATNSNPQSAIHSPHSSRRFDAGGYYTLRGRDSWCMIRCHTYRDRPAHVDMLHLDLWYKGVSVLGDSGTYKYFTPEGPHFEKYFKDIAAHNTVEIDGRGPLELVSRFIWLPWPRARCIEHTDDRFSGEHDAYARLPWNVTHRRTVLRVGESRWEVRDELSGKGTQPVKLRWHLADGPFQVAPHAREVAFDLQCGRVSLAFEAPPGMSVAVHRGAESPEQVAGWTSEYYGERMPRPTVEVSGRVELPAALVTRIRLGL